MTGAAGFIGSTLCDALLARGDAVVGYDNFSTGQAPFLAGARANPAFGLISADVLDEAALTAAMAGCDAVFHLAANADVRFGTQHPRRDLEQNTIATYNVLEAMRANGIRRILFSSTGSVYGEARVIPTPEDAPFPVQTSLYGASKIAGEGLISAYCEGFGLHGTVFRFVSILGPRYTHGHVFDFYRKLLADPARLPVLGNGLQRKSYLHVDDCVSALLLALERAPAPFEVYNLGQDAYCQVNDSIGWIGDELGLTPRLEYSGGERGWIGDNPFIFLDAVEDARPGLGAAASHRAGRAADAALAARQPMGAGESGMSGGFATSRELLAYALDPARVAQFTRDTCAAIAVAAAGNRLLIVGAAQLPRKVSRAIRAAGGRVAAHVEFDARFWGGAVDGVPVLSLDEALAITGPDPLAIVGIWSPQHIYARTRHWLAARGVARVLPVNAAFWNYADLIGPHYQFGPPDVYVRGAATIMAVHDALADGESRRQFAGAVAWRLLLDPALIPAPEPRRIYFDPALCRLPDDCVLADVGAYAGDTLDVFLMWQGRRFGRVLAFEPDPLSFARLEAYRARLPADVSARITCTNAALGAAAGTLRLTPTGTPGTMADAAGEVEVECLTLDAALDGGRVDYLKIDVEGFEPQVLAGAEASIMRCRPSIGLSIYHAPADIFALPAWVMGRVRDYSFHCRAHDHDGIDFVFYAIPREHAP